MCPCRRGMSLTPACSTVCGVTVRFDGRAASGAGTVGAGSATWSPSTSGRPRPTPGRWPATGRVIWYSRARPSAVATLVDRATRYAMVVALTRRVPGRRGGRRMLIERMGRLPTHLRRSLTWDRGREMAAPCGDHRGAVNCRCSSATRTTHGSAPRTQSAACARRRYESPLAGCEVFSVARSTRRRLVGLGFQSHVRRVGTPGQVALVTDHGILRSYDCALCHPGMSNICPDILTFNHKKVSLRLLCGELGGGDGAFDQSAEAFTGVFINDRRDRIGRPSSVTS